MSHNYYSCFLCQEHTTEKTHIPDSSMNTDAIKASTISLPTYIAFFYRIVLEMFFLFFYFQVPAAHVENGFNNHLPPGVNLNFIRNIYHTDNRRYWYLRHYVLMW